MLQYSKATEKNLNLLKGESKKIFSLLLQECYKQGINAQISSSLRKDEVEARRLYESGASNAKHAYESMHFYGIACDIFVNTNGKTDYKRNGEIWKICQELKLDIEYGMVWGKSFNDTAHFELSWGKSWRDFYALYQINPNQDFVVYKKSNKNTTQSNPVLQENNTSKSSVADIDLNATLNTDKKSIGGIIVAVLLKIFNNKFAVALKKEWCEVVSFFIGK